MKRVTGVGGVFITSKDPARLSARYAKHPGFQPDPGHGGVSLYWHEDKRDNPFTAWAIFPAESNYFDPSPAPFMINFRVTDLDRLLETPSAEGAAIDPNREDCDYGRFAWIFDPDGNNIELWEPPK